MKSQFARHGIPEEVRANGKVGNAVKTAKNAVKTAKNAVKTVKMR